jgi:hypothetical protein
MCLLRRQMNRRCCRVLVSTSCSRLRGWDRFDNFWRYGTKWHAIFARVGSCAVAVKAHTPGQLRKRLNKVAKSLSLSAPQFGKGIGNTYSAWAMFEFAGVLKARGHDVRPKDHAGDVPDLFVVRGGPGYIDAAYPAKPNRPCHFEIGGLASPAFELHASVRHLGTSEDDHELDLSVMPKEDVDLVRASGGVYAGSRIVGVEMKAYDAATQLDKNIPRAFCAVAVDLDPLLLLPQFGVFVAGRLYGFSTKLSPRYALLTTASVAESSKVFLRHHDVAFGEGVGPSSAARLWDIAGYIALMLNRS